MNPPFHILRPEPTEATARALAEILVDVVEGGASVGFLLPLDMQRALGYARGVLAAVERGERLLLVAQDAGGAIAGTVQLLLNMPENQPHRAEIAKLQVRRAARGRGIARALMHAAESEAQRLGRTLLVLDTATGSDAERLYSRLGWQRCGEIPGYALWPDGTPCATTIFCKTLNAGDSTALEQTRGRVMLET